MKEAVTGVQRCLMSFHHHHSGISLIPIQFLFIVILFLFYRICSVSKREKHRRGGK